MPELPEVETVRRGLEAVKHLLHFEKVEIREARLRYPVPAKRLKEVIPGCSVTNLARRGKYLLMFLDNSYCLIFHLGMSGCLLLSSSYDPLTKHDHVLFFLREGNQLRFRDPRRFGLIDLWPAEEINSHPRLMHLGPEPLSDDFSPDYCISKGEKTGRSVKQILMDSRFVVGLGNIYANEILYEAGIHPLRPGKTLTQNDWQEVVRAVRGVLTHAIDAGGTTLKDEGFRDVLDSGGRFQFALQAYGRDGEGCRKCGRIITKIRHNGRSSYYCPECQK